jgi:hypothetical protein
MASKVLVCNTTNILFCYSHIFVDTLGWTTKFQRLEEPHYSQISYSLISTYYTFFFYVHKYAGVEVKLAENFQMGVTNKTPEYLARHPLGQVPLLDTPEGPLFESVTLARYGTSLSIYPSILPFSCLFSYSRFLV